MKSQFFIFALFATLTPPFLPVLASTSSSTTGIPIETMADYYIIQALDKVADLEYQKIVDIIFIDLEASAKVACEDQNPLENSSLARNNSKIEVLNAFMIQFDVTLLTIQIINPEVYSELSALRERGYAQIQIIGNNIYQAMEFAQNKNSSGNLAEIQDLEIRTLIAAQAFIGVVYSAFPCGESDPARIKAAFSNAQEKSNVELRIAFESIYDGIKALQVAVTSGVQGESESVLCAIENAWHEASSALRVEVEIQFRLASNYLAAIHIIETGIAIDFSMIQTIKTAATSDYVKALEGFYTLPQDGSNNVACRNENGIILNADAIQAAEAEAFIARMAHGSQYLPEDDCSSITEIAQSEVSSATASAQHAACAALVKAVEAIHSGQETTLADFDTAYNGIFDIIVKFTKVDRRNARETENLLSTTKAINKKVFDAFSDAYVTTLAAIAIIQPDPSADTTDLEAESVKLTELVEGTYTAIVLSTNSSGTLAKIEEIEHEVTNKMVEIFQNIYNSIKTGRSDQTDVIDAIESFEAKGIPSVRIVYHAIFSTIKILFQAHSSKSSEEREDVLSAIEFARSFVSSISKDEIRNKFALIRTISIFSLVDDTRIMTNFSTIQSSEKNLLTAFNMTFTPIFSILYKLTESENISSEIEAAQEQVSSALIASYTTLIEAFEIIQTANTTIVTDENAIDEVINEAVDSILDAILKTQGRNSVGSIAEIEVIEEAVVADVVSFYTALYGIIANISSTQDDVTTAIESVKEQAIFDLEIAFRTLFAVIKIIATEDSSQTQIGSESVSFAIKTAEKVIFFKVGDEVGLKYALIRNLHTFNSLNNIGNMDYFSVSVIA